MKNGKKWEKRGTRQRRASLQVILLDECLASSLVFHSFSCPLEHFPQGSRGSGEVTCYNTNPVQPLV